MTTHQTGTWAKPIVAIVGGGFSGVCLALQLLRLGANAPRILLIERSGRFGPGLAYSSPDRRHLLNSRAHAREALQSKRRPEALARHLARFGVTGRCVLQRERRTSHLKLSKTGLSHGRDWFAAVDVEAQLLRHLAETLKGKDKRLIVSNGTAFYGDGHGRFLDETTCPTTIWRARAR